jgi:hypothetical protein
MPSNTPTLYVIVIILLFSFLFLQAQESTLVYPGADGKLVYTPHANIGETNAVNILPDFSYAGYMDGGVKLPVGEVAVKVTLYPAESGEDRTRIQAAIDQVCSLPVDASGFRGAVLLKKGRYRLNDGRIPNLSDGYGYALRIWASGVVLRGEGQGTDGTVLYSNYASNHTMITIEPPSRGLSQTNTQQITDDYVGTGARTFTVASVAGYSVGDFIMVRFTPNDTWFSDLRVTTGGFINDPSDYWTVPGEREAYNINYKRRITAINGNKITIDCPLVQPIQTKYGGGLITKYTTSGRIVRCGVEDLRIIGIEDGGSPSVSTNGNRLRVGIRPRFIDHSWIHGVTVARASEAAVMTWDVKNITVEECAYVDPRGSISGGWRYSFCLDAASTRVLFQRCYSHYGRHDFVTHARIPGPNVFLDCISENGLSILGPHHRWATGTLFDNIKGSTRMSVNEYASGSGGHAWCGAQTVGWNLECASYVNDAAKGSQNYLIGSIGSEAHGAVSHDMQPGSIFRGYWEKSGSNGVHVKTRSLYLKQLDDRLGTTAVENITLPDQLSGNMYAKLSAWAGNGMLDTVIVRLPAVSKIISNCDVSAGWTSSNTLTLNTSAKKEGVGSLQSTGSKTDDFRRVFYPAINTGASVETDSLQFWYYVSDTSLFAAANQVELGSGGKADVDEYNWDIGPLQNGWNFISLPLSSAGIMGAPDLNAINWFRIYRTKSGGTTTTRIDNIMFTNNAVSNTFTPIAGDLVRILYNPLNKNKLTIRLSESGDWNEAEVIITTLGGQVVYRNRIGHNNLLEINTAGLMSGSVCLVTIIAGNSAITKKVVLL